MAWMNYRFKRKEKALDYCEQYLHHDPSSAGMKLLKILAQEGKKQSKIKELEEMSAANPGYYRLYIQQGKLSKDIEKQISCYDMVRGFGYKEGEIECMIAIAYLSKGEGSQA